MNVLKPGFLPWLKNLFRNIRFSLITIIAIASSIITITYQGRDLTVPLWLFPLMVLVGLIWATYQIHKDVISQVPYISQSNKEFDTFIGTPMAALENDNEYKASRREVESLKSSLRKYCDFQHLFYAGSDIKSKKDFEPEDMAVLDNFKLIHQSRIFIMLYPISLPSRVLIEVGYAIAIGLPILILVKDENDLPYMLKRLNQVSDQYLIYTYIDEASFDNIFSKHGKRIMSRLLDKSN